MLAVAVNGSCLFMAGYSSDLHEYIIVTGLRMFRF